MTATQHIRSEPEGTLPSKDILFKRLTSISASSEIEGVTMDGKEFLAIDTGFDGIETVYGLGYRYTEGAQ